ncbi:MAG: aldo/keto reductase [Clostridia bacterium]|nr:aldo/keto reductase [Clostridia bacterium]
MKRITVGSKIDASAVAMGCMRIKDAAENADRIINTALECGIDYFDHADIYGGGECEEVFGKFLGSNKSVRDKITVQTKCAIRKGFYDFSKEHIINSVEGSLKRLKTDYVDVLLLHRPDTLMEPEEVAEAFSLLESEGKVKYFGVSNHNEKQIELLKTAVKQPLIINQLQLSIPESGMITSGLNVNMKNDESVMHDGGLLEYSRIKGITIQAWSPFQQGFIKKPFIGDRENFPELNKRLEELAEQYNAEPITIASAWILRHPANIQLISGSMNPDRIKAICKGADITLTREEWYSVYLAAGFRLP